MAATEQLRGRSLPDLREMLRRQEKLLGDRKFISRLPDKGKKISDFAEKLKLAISQEEELRRTAELLSAVRLEFQEKRQAFESSKRKTDAGNPGGNRQDPSLSTDTPVRVSQEPQRSLQNGQMVCSQNSARNKCAPAEKAFGPPIISQGDETVLFPPAGDNQEPPERTSLYKAESATVSTSRDTENLVDAFKRISVGEEDGGETGKGQRFKYAGNPFQTRLGGGSQVPHYIEVLEHRAKNPVVKRSRFKPSVLPAESSGSSRGSMEVPSPGAPSVLPSAEERRRREKKHLDDVTAARLPPLHHEPSQLISMEESIAIQIQQKEAYEEKQARLAAQNLSERLGIKMLRFEPEGKMVTGYREVQDEEGYSSGED